MAHPAVGTDVAVTDHWFEVLGVGAQLPHRGLGERAVLLADRAGRCQPEGQRQRASGR